MVTEELLSGLTTLQRKVVENLVTQAEKLSDENTKYKAKITELQQEIETLKTEKAQQTELKRALDTQKALKKELSRVYKTQSKVSEILSELIYYVSYSNGHLRVKWIDGPVNSLTQYKISDFVGKPAIWYTNIHQEDRGNISAIVEKLIENPRVVTLEYRITQPSGKTVWVEDKMTPVFSGKNVLAGFIGNVQDITRYKTQKTKHQKLQKLIIEHFEKTESIVFECNMNNELLTFNAVFENFCKQHYNRQLQAGDSIEFFANQQRRHWWSGIRRKVENGALFSTDYNLQINNAVFFYELWVHPQVDNEGKIKGYACFMTDISQQKATEFRNHEEKRWLTIAQSMAKFGNWMYNSKTGEKYWSPQVYKILGYDKKPAPCKALFTERIHKDDCKKLNSEIKNVLKNNKNELKTNIRIITPNKEVRYCTLFYQFVYDHENKMYKETCVIQDITRSYQVEKALRESESKFRGFTEQSLEGIVLIDNEGKVMDWNPAQEKLSGISYSEAKGQYIWDIDFSLLEKSQKTSQKYGQLKSSVSNYLKKKELNYYKFETIIVDRHNRKKDITSTTFPIRTKYGTILGRISHDVTAEKESASNIKKLSMVVEKGPLTIVIANGEKKIELINDYGLKKNEMEKNDIHKGINFFDFVFKSSKEQFCDYEKLKKGNAWKGEINYKQGNETRWNQTHLFTIKNEKDEVTYYVAIIADITERKQMTQKLKENNLQLRQQKEELENAKQNAEKANNAKTQFLANISHEIKTPMTAVLGYAQLLQNYQYDEEDTVFKRYVSSIASSGKTLMQLIEDILDISKIEVQKLQLRKDALNIRRLIDEIHQTFFIPLKNKNLELKIQINENVPEILFLDEKRLKQILVNLVGNAIKFTEKGFIELNLYSLEVKKRLLHNETIKTCTLHFSVKDTGYGIKPQEQKKIFEAFEQVDNHGSPTAGTGLGLAITRRLINLMQGDIEVESAEGKGACFRFFLPAVQIAENKKTNKTTSQIQKIHFKPETLLVVDDNQEILNYIKDVLADTQLHIIVAHNGKEALKILKHTQPAIIITDIKMPIMNGKELLERIKSDLRFNEIPIIATSASIQESLHTEYIGYDFDGFLSKPFNVMAIYKTLMEFVEYKNIEESKTTLSIFDKQLNLTHTHQQQKEEILNYFETELAPRWHALNEQLSFQDTYPFCDLLEEAGEKFEIPYLNEYSYRLRDETKNFAVNKMKDYINYFDKIFSSLKKKLEIEK